MKNNATLALAIAALFAAPAPAQQPAATDVGTISITGEGDQLGTGQIIPEDSSKARSTVTRAAIEKERPTANPFQTLNLLPGVNMYSQDATGLFGGGLRVRGFNTDQMGFTVDGAPVNDSGSFAVFPQEYTDIENTCEVFLTQGSADIDAPHVGATGGNIGIVTCDPLDGRSAKVSQTLGQLSMSKTFVRLDTGSLAFAHGWKTFVSYSHAEVDKFKGRGKADRDHVDAKTMLDLGGGSRLVMTALYNRAINNNYRAVTAAQYHAGGNLDYRDFFTPDPKPGPGAQVATSIFPDAYYKLSLNPFRNAIVTAKGNFQLTPRFRIDVEPYYWYGYGTGGNEQNTVREGGSFRGGVADVNGDGDRLDTVTVYRGSVTDTNRPGVTVKGNWLLDNQRITAGVWYERARHRQTQPATSVSADGVPADLWLESQLVLRADGTPFQGRDTLTISRAGSFFLNDSIGLMADRLRLDLGIKQPWIARSFRNYANEGSGAGQDYSTAKRWDEWLPSFGARYQLADEHQAFLNIARNFKVPGNFAWFGAIVSGVNRIDQINGQLKAETSTNYDLGYRWLAKGFTWSNTLYRVDFKNRLSRQFLPDFGVTLDTNVGDAWMHGFETEIGSRPWHGFSVYASLSYTKSRMKDNLAVSATNIQPTAGKEFPDAPNWLSGLSLQYATGPFYAQLQNKYVGKRYSTLVNDEYVGGYVTTDFNAGYRFADMGPLRSPTIRVNVSNILDRRYLSLNSGSGSQYTANATGTGASAPQYYVGAPRFASVTLTGEF